MWLKLGRAVAIGSALSLLLSAGVWAATWQFRPAGGAIVSGTVAPDVKSPDAPAGSGSPSRAPGLKERLENLDKLLHRESPNELPTPTLVAGSRGLEKPISPEPTGQQGPAKPEPVKPEPVKPEPVRPEPVKPETAKADPAKAEPGKANPVTSEPPKSEPVAPFIPTQPATEPSGPVVASGGHGHSEAHKGESKVEKKAGPD
ncbi:MAG: hypothetical protein ACYC6I_12175, partial [Bacillota bacterium]